MNKKNILSGMTTLLVLTIILFSGIFIGSEFGVFQRVEERIEEATEEKREKEYQPVVEHEKMVINVVESNLPAVVNIVATKSIEYIDFRRGDIFSFFEDPQIRERLQTEQGTGFIIQENGLILTNKHVVSNEGADYTVFLSNGEQFEAKVLARDPMQDLAVLKIEGEGFPTVKIGDSDTVRPGQTAIAIGNALGELQNTVSVGVISGTGRRVMARGGRTVEILDDVIQTDAAINFGNSGGPLLNLKGEVIGVNTATMMQAEGIGFAIPINKAKRAIEGAEKDGRVVYPFLGVRYVIVNKEVKEREGLNVDYGALIVAGGEDSGVVPGSSADEAGLKEGDVILTFGGKKITEEKSLALIISQYNPGDEVSLRIMKAGGEEKEVVVTLGEID